MEFFPSRSKILPSIYAYVDSNPDYEGLLKIGYTTKSVEERVAQQYPTKRPKGKKPYKIVFSKPAIYEDGSSFMDHDIHKMLEKRGMNNVGGEWFKCTLRDLEAAYLSVVKRTENIESRTKNFTMRPEQEHAVNETIKYFHSIQKESDDQNAKFLWNAKMRFGKTFATYQLAKRENYKRVLILTFKPAVENSWEEDLSSHIDFEGWQFISRNSSLTFDATNKKSPIVCFGSFQDYLGTNQSGGIKAKNEWVHTTNWDLVVFDEYHFGAWRENAKRLFDQDNEDDYDAVDLETYKEKEADNAINESFLPITSSRFLYLSGTPFRAINSGEFIEEQIFPWTYSDEQRSKEEWTEPPENPYSPLPRMVMMTYSIPQSIKKIALRGEFDEFDLSEFFSAYGEYEDAKFKHEDYVQKWLDLIRGSYMSSATDDLKLGTKKPLMPFSNARLLSILTHTFWFVPDVASAYAMRNLMRRKNNHFFDDYEIIVAAGRKAGIGKDALKPVNKAMGNPLESKTITISCGKLTTGVTVKPWTGIFMLRNLSSPETYFQAAFRVQSPWVIPNDNLENEILKKECYVFDFALERSLRQISDYSSRLNVNESNPEKKVEEFIKFLPVIAYSGSVMRQIEASEILDIAMAGTSASMLARRFESALLVNVDNSTLGRLMANKKAMEALMSIEGFRSLNKEINTIINYSNDVKKAKSKDEGSDTKKRKEISEKEKEYKNKRKKIQEKLIKFATRIPIFMYLTDFREYSLKDVITQLEPGLFKRVTGLNVKDFELLVSIGVFNGPLMNDAVYKFKRYEDASLEYTGINRHQGESVGGYDTVLSSKEYEELYYQQQKSLTNNEANPKNLSVENNVDNRSKTQLKVHSSNKNKTKKWNVEVGQLVYHKTFGKGHVTQITKDRIKIKFSQAEKTFMYPNSFENGFIKIL